jgi:hypothetical protein
VTTSRRSVRHWRSPYLVPLYALVAAFLLTVVVGAGSPEVPAVIGEAGEEAAEEEATPSPDEAAGQEGFDWLPRAPAEPDALVSGLCTSPSSNRTAQVCGRR